MTEAALPASHNLSLEEIDREHVFHPNTNVRQFAHGELGDPTIVTSTNGIWIRDQRGREYIDAFASLWCVNVGYGRPEIADALYKQARAMAYYHTHAGHSSEPVIRLTDRVVRMAPAGLGKVFWGLQGSASLLELVPVDLTPGEPLLQDLHRRRAAAPGRDATVSEGADEDYHANNQQYREEN